METIDVNSIAIILLSIATVINSITLLILRERMKGRW